MKSSSKPHIPDIVEQAFDAESFRSLGHAVVDQLADNLNQTRHCQMPVRSPQSPEEAHAFWMEKLGDEGSTPSLIEDVLAHTFQSHHPRNLGHQVGPVLPEIALIDLVGSILDTGNGIFEVGNPATPMERVVIQEMTQRIGLPAGADGVLTSGGSLGNLTAMLAMRQCQVGDWDEGTKGACHAVLVSEEAHYCVARAAKIMGWGDTGVIPVTVDENYRMRMDVLEEKFAKARESGVQVLGVIGSAGSTATGRIDPLVEIAAFCRGHDLWFHVDAAHAGAFVYSAKAKPLVHGIELADSVVIDFHKMLLSSSLLTAVLFRRADDSFQTFAQRADYLWRKDGSAEWWNAAKRTLECTRPMLGLRAYAIMKAGRSGLFEAYIDHALTITHDFAELVKAASDFELLAAPESNILCYRYTPAEMPESKCNVLNERIRMEISDSGDFYIVQVEKHGRIYLRSALMNPFVQVSVCASLLERIRSIGRGDQTGSA